MSWTEVLPEEEKEEEEQHEDDDEELPVPDSGEGDEDEDDEAEDDFCNPLRTSPLPEAEPGPIPMSGPAAGGPRVRCPAPEAGLLEGAAGPELLLSSQHQDISAVVPQGIVLDPTIFSCFINDHPFII
eukprot:g41222.t1